MQLNRKKLLAGGYDYLKPLGYQPCSLGMYKNFGGYVFVIDDLPFHTNKPSLIQMAFGDPESRSALSTVRSFPLAGLTSHAIQIAERQALASEHEFTSAGENHLYGLMKTLASWRPADDPVIGEFF